MRGELRSFVCVGFRRVPRCMSFNKSLRSVFEVPFFPLGRLGAAGGGGAPGGGGGGGILEQLTHIVRPS